MLLVSKLVGAGCFCSHWHVVSSRRRRQLLSAGYFAVLAAARLRLPVARRISRKACYDIALLRFELARRKPYSDEPDAMKLELNDEEEKATGFIRVALVWLPLPRYGFPAGK